MNKKAFTLIELAIVIVLVSVVYILGFSNLSFFAKQKEIKLQNLKSYLQKQDFSKNLNLVCLDEDSELCLIYEDDVLTKQIKNPFGKIYSVYTLDNERKRVDFRDIKLKESFKRVVLNIYFDKQGKQSNYIIETQEEVFISNSLKEQFLKYDSIGDYLDKAQKNISEVRDAF